MRRTDCSFNMYTGTSYCIFYILYSNYRDFDSNITDLHRMWVRSTQEVTCVLSYQSAYCIYCCLFREDRSVVDYLHNPGKINDHCATIPQWYIFIAYFSLWFCSSNPFGKWSVSLFTGPCVTVTIYAGKKKRAEPLLKELIRERA